MGTDDGDGVPTLPAMGKGGVALTLPAMGMDDVMRVGRTMVMDDGVGLRTWSGRGTGPGVVLINGGPGLPDYLAPVAGLVEHLGVVHRYDQRGTGDSPWVGEHSFGRHVRDLELLLDGWGHGAAVLVGHSYGTELALRFLLAHRERVAGLVLIAGPFVEPWRAADRAAQRERRTGEQQDRFEELERIEGRTEAEEIEYLTLAWSTDHADRERAWDWARDSARRVRPVNYVMNRQLGAAGRADPLESHLDELRDLRPPGTVIIGGSGDSRPAEALRRAGDRLGCAVVIMPGAGHSPWLEDLSGLRRQLERALAAGAG